MNKAYLKKQRAKYTSKNYNNHKNTMLKKDEEAPMVDEFLDQIRRFKTRQFTLNSSIDILLYVRKIQPLSYSTIQFLVMI